MHIEEDLVALIQKTPKKLLQTFFQMKFGMTGGIPYMTLIMNLLKKNVTLLKFFL